MRLSIWYTVAASFFVVEKASCFTPGLLPNGGSVARTEFQKRGKNNHHGLIRPDIGLQRTVGCIKSSSNSQLFSLNNFVDDIMSSNKKQTIFVGGKGGVGKTSVSSALAVKLAMNDLKVLVVSTDPAHSLGDALDEDLGKGMGRPITMTDPLTAGRLDAAEFNAAEALRDFRDSLKGFDVDRLAEALGVDSSFLDSLGLRELSSLLNNPPPGLDELVALGNIIEDSSDYDVVVVDTAPTGHTLRLLTLPKFLDGLLGKLIKLRMKLSGLTSTLKAFLGDSGAQTRAQTIDDALDKLEAFRVKISNLEARLKDSSTTNFLVVTIPTKLAVEESKRLVKELGRQGIMVRDVVVNQCIGDIEGSDSAKNDAIVAYYNRRMSSQRKWIDRLKDAASSVSSSSEFKSNGDPSPIEVTELPFFDVELVGIPALGYIGAQELADRSSFKHLMDASDDSGKPKVVICGGKGGVGKTTTSSSLAVTLAAKGHNVALISTDPAHSLGDAINMDLKGGKLVDCSLMGVPGFEIGEGSLSALEIDPSASLGEFKQLVDQLLGSVEGGGDGSEIRKTLQDLEGVFDTLPAGTDEVVALAKVVNLVKKGNFDRIVLDTAPTGHTLRMLSTPAFLGEFIERLLGISDKITSNAAVKLFLASATKGKNEALESAAAAAKSKLLSFQFQMYDLEDMFADPDQTEFLVVTIPTELAVRESVRLVNNLTFEAPDMPIKVRNIVVNQVLDDDESKFVAFLSHVSDSQKKSLDALEQEFHNSPNAPAITKIQYLDTEPRGVFGLKILADQLLQEEEISAI